MTIQELTSLLKEYAQQDIKICKESGAVAVTNTALGNIWLTYENGSFRAGDNNGTTHLEEATEEQVQELLINNYQLNLG